MPWLVLHPLLPLVLLAGIGAELCERGPPLRRVAALAAAWRRARFLVFGGVNCRLRPPRRPRGAPRLHPDVRGSAPDPRRILSSTAPITATCDIDVDSTPGVATGWPWAWYLRDAPVGYPDMSVASPRTADAVIVTDINRQRSAALNGYRGPLPSARVVGGRLGALTPSATWRWFLRREAWSVKGPSTSGSTSARRPRAGSRAACDAAAITRQDQRREHEERNDAEGVEHERERQALRVLDPVGGEGEHGRPLEHSQSGRRRGQHHSQPDRDHDEQAGERGERRGEGEGTSQ